MHFNSQKKHLFINVITNTLRLSVNLRLNEGNMEEGVEQGV